mmetsp:Transcript_20756/g.44302  ORF Transcript_20756/g.44302 Transcript_20756/m.44302 type:complete len:89 (+) Transcript_20756:326-592(+)
MGIKHDAQAGHHAAGCVVVCWLFSSLRIIPLPQKTLKMGGRRRHLNKTICNHRSPLLSGHGSWHMLTTSTHTIYVDEWAPSWAIAEER